MQQPSSRIDTLDALRGVAILGILLMNIIWFGMPEKAVEDLGIRGEYSGPNYWAWWVIEGYFHGNMRGIFSMLFGASAVLILEQYAQRNNLDSAAEYYYRRLVVLFLFGLFNAFILLWPSDILFTYAIAGMFVFPLYRLPIKRILVIAGVVMLLYCMRTTWLSHKPIRLKQAAQSALVIDTFKKPLTRIQKADIEAWNTYVQEQTPEYKRKVDEDQVERTQGDFWTFFLYSASISYFLETSLFYDFFFLDAFPFMLIGIVLYRMSILTGKRSKRFYLNLGLVGYAMGLPLYYWMAATKIKYGFDPYQIALHEPFYFHPFGRLAMTLGNLGFLIFLFKLPIMSWFKQLMLPVGRMAFTNYLMQSIICALIFSGFAFGMFNKLQRYELYYVVGCIWIFQIVFSHIWMYFFVIGPLEWLWRSAALGAWQKFDRRK